MNEGGQVSPFFMINCFQYHREVVSAGVAISNHGHAKKLEIATVVALLRNDHHVIISAATPKLSSLEFPINISVHSLIS